MIWGETVLECEKDVKLLGVTIDFMLDFNIHITNMCRKAARQLNVLKRIGYHLNRLSRMTIYYSFIMSNFIYSDNYTSYEKLLEKSMMPSLKIRRLRMIAIETFKILHKSSPVFFLQDLINIKNHSYNFRYTNTADIPNVRTTRYGLKS